MELKDSRDLTLEELRTELLSVKGIGKETADSIILYAFHRPIFVIDAYTRRFCKEFFDVEFRDRDYDEYRKFFESALPNDVALFKEYHALIVEWGSKITSFTSSVNIYKSLLHIVICEYHGKCNNCSPRGIEEAVRCPCRNKLERSCQAGMVEEGKRAGTSEQINQGNQCQR